LNSLFEKKHETASTARYERRNGNIFPATSVFSHPLLAARLAFATLKERIGSKRGSYHSLVFIASPN